ncbi:hypothetical protein ELUMI_v1c05260 [Williamsoniiplasma luminosum]|uniref:DUF87 domain-containing protein n=1 Tax=Williamsoniiplasma luminosum TaxID=214888 RepID=A0A2K8NTT4_9MOLU|nr:hypothetical protein [Williamsoniiplasma luminosum]ATZ17250.1 hypothetical protein ELUMI_v1c05260 [Williamsoniiplasma luminosum]
MNKNLTITYKQRNKMNDTIYVTGRSGVGKTSWMVNELKNIVSTKHKIIIYDAENEYHVINKTATITHDFLELTLLVNSNRSAKPIILIIDSLDTIPTHPFGRTLSFENEILNLPIEKIYLVKQEKE